MHNILIVDDVELNIRLLKRIISKDVNPVFFTANNIFQAMRILNTQHIDLALIDVNLKNYSGYDIAIEIDKCPNMRKTPLIFITATETEENKIMKGYKVGAVDYIIKPINKIVLNYKIKNLLKLFDLEKKLKKELLIQKINNSNMKKQLELCNTFQSKLLPNDLINEDISIKGYHDSYNYIGGDIYYWKKLNSKKYFIILLDVMGHSIYTSILAIYIRSKLEEFISLTNDITKINSQINKLINDFNENLIKNSSIDINFFATAITLTINLDNSKIEYLSAGHNPMFMINNDKLKFLNSNTLPLGILSECDFKSNSIYYENNFEILLFTDGIGFLENSSLDKQKHYINKIIKSNETIYENLVNKVNQYDNNDDISLIQIKVGEQNE